MVQLLQQAGKVNSIMFISWMTTNYFTKVYPIEKKSDILLMFQKYEVLIVAHFSDKISFLHCDNGGEYTSKSLTNICAEKKYSATIHYMIYATAKWSRRMPK